MSTTLAIVIGIVCIVFLGTFRRRKTVKKPIIQRDPYDSELGRIVKALQDKIGTVTLSHLQDYTIPPLEGWGKIDPNEPYPHVLIDPWRDAAPWDSQYAGTVILNHKWLLGDYVHPVVGSLDKQYVLLGRWAEPAGPFKAVAQTKMFSAVLIDLIERKVYESKRLFNLICPSATDGEIVVVHEACHTGLPVRARVLRVSAGDFKLIGGLEEIIGPPRERGRPGAGPEAAR